MVTISLNKARLANSAASVCYTVYSVSILVIQYRLFRHNYVGYNVLLKYRLICRQALADKAVA
jgi:hypothetical protein